MSRIKDVYVSPGRPPKGKFLRKALIHPRVKCSKLLKGKCDCADCGKH
jgi:hypothetical protein